MKFSPERNWFDHLLVLISCVLATFSIGMSVRSPGTAMFLAGGTAVTSILALFIGRKLEGTKWIRLDGYLTALAGLLCFFGTRSLNGILPDGGFPFAIIIASFLGWMVMVCSLFAWRDAMLLFLTVPCIVLFSLVGTLDTFPPGTLLFFVFLISMGVLYARAHQRAMLEQAKASGVREPERLRRDAWRWMAGPEWAFASAGAIVLVAVMAAPLVRFSLSGISPRLELNLPTRLPQSANVNVGQGRSAGTDQQVGRGPIRSLSETPVLRVTMDEPWLLRDRSYRIYNGAGWNIGTPTMMFEGTAPLRPDISFDLPSGFTWIHPSGSPPSEPIDNPKFAEIELVVLSGEHSLIPSPGPVVAAAGTAFEFMTGPDGTLAWRTRPRPGDSTSVLAAVPNRTPTDRPAKLPPALQSLAPEYLGVRNLHPEVRGLVQEAIQGAETDWQKAVAVQEAIRSRVRYNLNAPAVPSGQDAAHYFLFRSREGYCDLFATSMVLMAREAGLPARYVVGWLVDPILDSQGAYTVREKDYHAWAEIYFEGVGWVPFDATEGAEQVPGSGRGAPRIPQRAWYESELARNVLQVVAVGAMLAAPVAWFLFGRKGPAVGIRTDPAISRAHQRFQRALERRVRHPRRFSQTLREFVAGAGESLGECQGQAQDLATRFEAALYSPTPPDKAAAAKLAADVKRFAADLRRLPKPN